MKGELLDETGLRHLSALLLGFRGVKSWNCYHLYVNLEGSYDTEESWRVLGSGGLRWSF